ncbi:hypothetical protein ZWY2020_010086 [Hordeum vulgare]|nr:hypothetical protein ZWY2020_010086 [Hordeum vulgare]
MSHHLAATTPSVRPSSTPLPLPLQRARPLSQRTNFVATRTGRKPVASVAAAAASPTHRVDEMSEHQGIRERVAVVTGGNRGIGIEVCRQLALQGVTVILTARDEERGKAAVESIRSESNLSDIIFHQLDILDAGSRASLARHIETRYGKLDILVNNAGVGGVAVDQEGLRALNIDPKMWLSGKAAHLIESVIIQTYDEAVKCLNTNYYGLKWATEALLPLLKKSTSGARIINTTSLRSELQRMPNEKLRESLHDANSWDEARIEAMLSEFLEDMKNERLEAAGWPMMLPAYSMSKMVVNLYTRILARRHPEMRINCVHPGFVKTEINWNTGVLSPEEGARGAVILALAPGDGPTGCYFDQTKMGEAW